MSSEKSTSNSTPEAAVISTADTIQHLKLSLQMPAIVYSIANQKIIKQTAVQKNIILSEQELQTAADRFRYENNLIGSSTTLNWLKNYYLSVTEFEELIKNTLLSQKLAQHLFQDRVEAYFYAHQLDYHQAVIYEIVLEDFDLAMELYYGLQEQELSFWDLAHQYIEERELRRRGGYKGKQTRQQLHPEIAAAVFSSTNNIPQVLKPITVDKKTYLIYVEEIIQPALDEPLRQVILNQLWENWLSQQRQQLIENLQIVNQD